MRKLVFIIMFSFMAVGCSRSQNMQQMSTNESITLPTFKIPSYVTWNSHKYVTTGRIQTVGRKLGVTYFPIHANVFDVPGKNSDKEIAFEVDAPDAKYMTANRVGG